MEVQDQSGTHAWTPNPAGIALQRGKQELLANNRSSNIWANQALLKCSKAFYELLF